MASAARGARSIRAARGAARRWRGRLLAGAALGACLAPTALAAGSPATAGSVLFREAISRVRLAENGSDAVATWARDGERAAVVLHVDARHNLLTDGRAGDFAGLRALLAAGDVAGVEAAAGGTLLSDYDQNSYLAAAFHIGLAREIWWVPPVRRPFDDAFLRELKASLAEPEGVFFERAEIEAFRRDGPHVRGTLGGVPLVISRIDDLPAFAEPVLLDIDCEYFLGAALQSGAPGGMQEALRSFRDSLAARGIRGASAFVSYSVEGQVVPLHMKYIGRVLQIWLEHPGEDGAFDEAGWQAFWEGERAFFKREYAYARSRFAKAARSAQAGPYAEFSLVVTDVAEDDAPGALRRLDELAGKRPEFALGFIIIGDYLYARLNYAEAFQAYRRAIPYGDRGPLLTPRNLGLPGKVLFNAGRYAEAAEYYSMLLLLLPGERLFRGYLADAYYLGGEKDQAFDLYREIWQGSGTAHQLENRNFLRHFLELADERGERELAAEIRRGIAALPPRARPFPTP